MRKISLDEISEALQKSLNDMTALEMLIIYLKIEKNLTLVAIGERLCMSHEMVRLHLKNAYKHIKKNINENIP